jgi:DNA-binding PadR family transcriptional regulator
MSEPTLTQADMVVLSLLLERPMHGYDLVQEYNRQEVRDWAFVSRAQVYYALKKLEQSGQIAAESAGDGGNPRGKTVYRVTAEGQATLERQLLGDQWIEQRYPQPFTTWMGLSMHCSEGEQREMIEQRRAFLERELQRERTSYDLVATMTSARAEAGLKIITLTIALIETELQWLETVSRSVERT